MTHTQVLVVEDKSIIARDIENKLTHLGYAVTGIVNSGRQALRTVKQKSPDIILMDIRLKGKIDGIETARQMRNRFNVPVVYLTAYSDISTLQRVKKTEPYGYILKPFEEKELHTTLEMALNLFNMERRLKESQQWFATTLRSIGDAVIATDEAGCVRFINPNAELLTGWTGNKAIGRGLDEILILCDVETRQPREQLIGEMAHSDSTSDHALLLGKDGSERIISYRAAYIRDKKTKILGSVLVLQDITEKLKTEQELIKAQKLESIGTLAGGIAHDFNNLLTAISGNIALAQSDLSSKEETSALLQKSEKACFRAKNLTDQLLTFARGGAPIKKLASIAELVKESADFVLGGSNVRCEFAIANDLWAVNVDMGQISQVINNLVINAAQAIPAGGTILVTAENVSLGNHGPISLSAGDYIKISVADQGPGILPNVMSRIFDPYFTTKEKGKGIGLTAAYSIIQKHNGCIQVDSKPNVGSIFTIFLPAQRMKIMAEPDEHGTPSLSKCKLLVMDDEEIIRNLAYETLSKLGGEVHLAVDGLQAIELYQRAKDEGRPFDIVIMDLTVRGGMGGKETISKLRQIDPKIKAIVSSGYSNDPVMAKFEKYGFKGFVSKPYNINELKKVISKVL